MEADTVRAGLILVFAAAITLLKPLAGPVFLALIALAALASTFSVKAGIAVSVSMPLVIAAMSPAAGAASAAFLALSLLASGED